MTKPTGQWEWSRIHNKITPAIFAAPRLDPHRVGWHCVRYLYNNVLPYPWHDHMALLTLVLSDYAQLEPSSLMKSLSQLHTGLRLVFEHNHLHSLQDWNPAEHVRQLVEDAVFTISPYQRQAFLEAYKSTGEHLARYLHILTEAECQEIQPLILAPLPLGIFHVLTRAHDIQTQQRQRRKQQSDALLPQFITLRSEAHMRWNAVKRLYCAYQHAVQDCESGKQTLPVTYTYPDPRFGSMRFTLWSRAAFVRSHANHYLRDTFWRTSLLPQEKSSAYFLEFHPSAETSDAFLWFTLGTPEPHATSASPKKLLPVPLTKKEKMQGFLTQAQMRTSGVICDPDAVYAAATFGLVAIEFITTTGARINEVLQLSVSRDCLQTLRVDGEQRLIVKLLPKGAEREATYFVGTEMKHTLDKAIAMHKDILRAAHLPHVPFNPTLLRSHRFPTRPYLLQYWQRHLDDGQLTACLRFLCTGIAFATAAGDEVILTAHLLRHAFANYVVQEEKHSLEFLAQLLHHRDLGVTAYYSEPSAHQMQEHVDRVLASFTEDLGDLNAMAQRAPAELRHQLHDAQKHIGTLSHVVGGACTFHQVCPVSLACLGCPWKVPDPARRDEVVEAREVAVTRLQFATTNHLRLEIAKQQRVIQVCDQELDEMQRMHDYRADEHQHPVLQPENEGA